jgi:hypothetical protein
MTASAPSVGFVTVPPLPVIEKLLSLPVVRLVTCRANSVAPTCTTAALSPWVLALMAAAASVSETVPSSSVSVSVMAGVLAAPSLSVTVMLEAPYAAFADVQVLFFSSTECAVAVPSTLKVSDPGIAPPLADTDTLPEELLALTGVQTSGFMAASAAARTARKVVLTVR